MLESKDFRNKLKLEGVNARGYGIIPKMLMLDREVTIEAKAIYSYFCSYAGAGTQAFPSVKKIIEDLGITKTRYYKHFDILKNLGYISVEQLKTEKGSFKHNLYTLITNPKPLEKSKNKLSTDFVNNSVDNTVDNLCDDSKKPCPNFKDTDKSKLNTTSYPCPNFGDTENPYTGNKDTNINNVFNNNNLLYNHQSSKEDEDVNKLFNEILNNANINEHFLGKNYELVFKCLEYLYFNTKCTINGVKMDIHSMRKDLKKLTQFHIEFAIETFQKIIEKTVINNVIPYLSTCIYTSIFETDIKTNNILKINNLI